MNLENFANMGRLTPETYKAQQEAMKVISLPSKKEEQTGFVSRISNGPDRHIYLGTYKEKKESIKAYKIAKSFIRKSKAPTKQQIREKVNKWRITVGLVPLFDSKENRTDIKRLKITKRDNKYMVLCYLFGTLHNLMQRAKSRYNHDEMIEFVEKANTRKLKLVSSLSVEKGTKDIRFKEYLRSGNESLFLALESEYNKRGVITEYNQTGICKINIARLFNKWNHLYHLTEDSAFRLVKLLRKDSDKQTIKATISKDQASDLIERLGLKSYNEASGIVWRRPQDARFWAKYRKSKR